ncbi:MAG: apolipoprotein N-acyltransferase [Candidatus Krumholzibacteriota bacterium]|nr:apolipoprotein N-acyltransferase [Candidatus Krumholzibacteriota bacterium]
MGGDSFVYRWRQEIFAGVTGGLLLSLSFPPFPTRFLALVSLVPVIRYFLIEFPARAGDKGCLRRGFGVGFYFGLAFFLALLFWIINLIPESSINLSWVLFPALVLLVMYLACFTGLATLGLAWMIKRFGPAGLFSAPAFWALMEFARSRGELAFSWGVISSSLANFPPAIQGHSIYGPFGMSLILVLVNVLLCCACFSPAKKSRLTALAVLILLVGGHLLWGSSRISRLDKSLREQNPVKNVAVIQANVSLAIKWRPEYRDSVFTKLEILTRKAAAAGASLVIFPETSAPVSLSHAVKYRNWIGRMARQSEVEILIGYIYHLQEGDEWVPYNACGLFNKRGELVSQYQKINLLPFGERMPFSQYIIPLGRLDFGQANFKPGQKMTIFNSSAGKFGTLICFESTFSGFAGRYIRDGARFLVNITNDGWFGSTRGPKQHMETAILRAVENGVTLLRAANTGISLFVDPAGRVVENIGLDKGGIIMASIYRPPGPTLYGRAGQLPFLILVLISLAAAPVYSRMGRGR